MDSATTRSSVLSNAVKSLTAVKGVEGIYLSGSLAERIEDRYSDIDLRVVVADEDYEFVLAMRERLPRTWGPFLFHSMVASNFTVSYYETVTKADVFYYAAGALLPSPWFNLGTEILLDRTGRLADIVSRSQALTFLPMPDEIAHHLQKCLAGLIEGAKRVRRQEPLYAWHICAEAVHHLLVADDLIVGRAPLGSSKRERLPSDSLTRTAVASIGMPSLVDCRPYFSRLGEALKTCVLAAHKRGHCSNEEADRLSMAIGQMIALAAGP